MAGLSLLMITLANKILLFGLLLMITTGISLRGAGPQASSSPDEDNMNGHAAKIVAMDDVEKTLTLHIKDKNYLFLLNPHAVNTKTRRQIALNQLAAGQFIRFIARPQSRGRLEIVSITILPPKETGNPGAGGNKYGGDVSPFR